MHTAIRPGDISRGVFGVRICSTWRQNIVLAYYPMAYWEGWSLAMHNPFPKKGRDVLNMSRRVMGQGCASASISFQGQISVSTMDGGLTGREDSSSTWERSFS